VSVIDLPTFRVETTLDVAPNLHRVVADAYGQVWVSSRGDYLSQPSCLSCINSQDDTVGHRLDLSTSNMTLSGASLFVIGSEWSNVTNKNTVGYAIVNVRTHQIVTRSFITDGTDAAIKVPYGIAVNPDTKDIYITDAGNYVSPGQLYCFTPDGRLKWKVRTGDIPAHFAFTTSK
jgi:DNA-binding beta-propeller fold protein YncE